MRRAAYFLTTAILLLAGTVPRCLDAQTYNPKSIHFESTDASEPLDSAELLRITGLHQGVSLSKADIEAALQKLGDSGAFSNLSYSVNDTALTIRLTPAGGGQAMPVRFANFVWWQDDELIQILESRVPLFHGELPLQGNQTGQVEDALVALLREKGIPDARVTAIPSASSSGGPMGAVALSITSPEILIGDIQFNGAVPEVAAKLTTFDRELTGRDFDRLDLTNTIRETTQEIFQDSGYLDIASDIPTFATPRKDLDRYVVDVQVTLHPGALYRISTIALEPQPPLSASDLRAVLPFKSGDPASASDFRVAVGTLARAYADRGYLEAHTGASVNRDSANHTIAYSFTFSPGAQFHLAAVDTSSLPTDLQQTFAAAWHVAPGTLVDKALMDNLRSAVRTLHTRSGIMVLEKRDRSAHTVILKLQLHPSGAGGPSSSPDSTPDITEPSTTPK